MCDLVLFSSFILLFFLFALFIYNIAMVVVCNVMHFLLFQQQQQQNPQIPTYLYIHIYLHVHFYHYHIQEIYTNRKLVEDNIEYLLISKKIKIKKKKYRNCFVLGGFTTPLNTFKYQRVFCPSPSSV